MARQGRQWHHKILEFAAIGNNNIAKQGTPFLKFKN
jgi:hypothetical protein